MTMGGDEDAQARVARENALLGEAAPAARFDRRAGEAAVRDMETGEVWSAALVKGRLREAAQVSETWPEDRPRFRSGVWPVFEPEYGEFARAVEAAKRGELQRDQARQNRARVAPSRRMIARAEEALEWPWRYLSAPEHVEERSLLKLWMFAEAKGYFWEEALAYAARPKRTANRRRADAFELICAGLLRDGIAP